MCRTSSRLILCGLVLAWNVLAADKYQASEPHMGSLASVTLYADSPEQAQQAFVAAFQRIAELDRILSDYNPESELSNACQGRPLSPDLLRVVEYSQELARSTDGAFDITVGPLTQLWRQARKEKRLPTPAETEGALNRSGYRKLKVENGRLQCLADGMRLDAGGIAKGYAADEALRAIRRVGVKSALVAMSGDIAAGAPPPGRSGWSVKIFSFVELLADAAVSTSGDEFQFLEIDGVRYSHIVDPRNGQPLANSTAYAVIAPTGIEADTLATALSVDFEKAAEIARRRPEIRIFIHGQ